MIWAKEETYLRTEMENLQSERLIKQVKAAYEGLPFYRKKMDDLGLKLDDIKSVSDLDKLPFVTKQDFRDQYPFGMFAVPKNKIKRIHASSGTTGKPTVVGYTDEDMKNWTETVTRIAVMGGAREDDLAQICFGYGMFTGALGLHYGLENLGCDIVPASAGNTNKQLMYMTDFGTTLLVATPSYALYIGESAREHGYKPKDFNVRIGLLGGEGLSEKMRKQLGELWGNEVLFTQNYGMSELNGPGIAGECEELCGMHINEDHFIAEVINPETLEVLPEGSQGELVITCITKEAIPLLRYRTRDITTLDKSKCTCGRTTLRMSPLHGRSDDMLVIRGVNLFPSQIEQAIFNIDGIGANYELTVERIKHMDNLIVSLELSDSSLLDSYSKLERLQKTAQAEIKDITGLDAVVKLLAPRSLERFEGKAKRIKDLRDK